MEGACSTGGRACGGAVLWGQCQRHTPLRWRSRGARRYVYTQRWHVLIVEHDTDGAAAAQLGRQVAREEDGQDGAEDETASQERGGSSAALGWVFLVLAAGAWEEVGNGLLSLAHYHQLQITTQLLWHWHWSLQLVLSTRKGNRGCLEMPRGAPQERVCIPRRPSHSFLGATPTLQTLQKLAETNTGNAEHMTTHTYIYIYIDRTEKTEKYTV